MDRSRSIVLAVVFLFLSASAGIAQSQPAGTAPKNDESDSAEDYSSLINRLFAPITGKLKLTNEQQMQIVAIITETEVKADPWAQSIQLIEQQLSQISLDEPLDEAKVEELSDREAALLSDVIQMKVRAKWSIYRLLTPEQRALVAREFRLQNQLKGNLGSFSNY